MIGVINPAVWLQFNIYTLNERTLKENTLELGKINIDSIFKDTYMLDFLNLPKDYSENDLEKALVKNLKDFILEFGKDFTLIGEQFRLQVGKHDYYLDLLMYHRGYNVCSY